MNLRKKATGPQNGFATPHTAPTFGALLALLTGATSIVAVRKHGVWMGGQR